MENQHGKSRAHAVFWREATNIPSNGVGLADGNGRVEVREVDGVASESAGSLGQGVDHGDEGRSGTSEHRGLHFER